MANVLVVVESPAKAKTISKFLGKKYTVKASMGHVRDLPKSQLGVEVDQDIKIKYITIRGKGKMLQEMRQLAQKSDKILLATDPDREGEAIAWHLQEMFKIPADEKCRIEFNEITKKTITEAIKHPRQLDCDLIDSQQARRVLDRLVGYNLSPLLWRKVRKGLSAGRVQSVVVRLICDREVEINKFEPQEYWSLTANLKKDKQTFEATLQKIAQKKAELKNEEETQAVINAIGKSDFLVDTVKKRQTKRNPAFPFTTSSLQQEAYRKLNFTVKKTMRVAQQLYEGLDLSSKEGAVGLITYMRTDSTRVSDEAANEAKQFIMDKHGEEYIPDKPRQAVSKGKVQDAHECVRPSSVVREPSSIKEFLKPDQYKLYKLIWERFIASQMAPALSDVTTVDLTVKQYTFRASGSIMVFPGFTKVYEEGQDNKPEEKKGLLPLLQEKEAVALQEILPKQHFTQPPPRFTEATLIKTLEEKGIGRPSTYAPILDTIVSRNYVEKIQKQYTPTELGFVVVDLLKKYFQEIMDIEFTANMEQKLDKIEEGDANWKDVLLDFYRPFKLELDIAEEEIGHIELKDEESDVVCEKCGRNMVIKHGRYGKFLACPGFPECRNTKPILTEIGVACPQCKEGKVVMRNSKKGRKFYGCSNYPDCSFVSWDEPSNEKCPECKGHLVIKRARGKNDRLVCGDKECGYSKEIIAVANNE